MRTRWMAALLLALVCMASHSPGTAQEEPVMPPETARLFEDLDDIDKMRILNPVNLTAAQLDKIIPLLKARQKAYNERILELAVGPLKTISEQIRGTRAKLLAGGQIPTEFDDRIKRNQREFRDKRKIEQDKTLKLVADGIRAVLTETQYKAIVSMARTDFSSAKGTDEQFFNLWVQETIIAYPRIVPLLEDMRKARAAPEAKPAAP